MNPVAITGLMVAAIRAEESERPDRLFDDPFAAALAGDAGREVLEKYRDSAPKPSVPAIEVRTRWYDEAIARALESGVRQVVILAAGMDARAYRLDWPSGTRVFEIDQSAVLEYKERVLAAVAPRCARIAISWDLSQDWTSELARAGFDPRTPTCWLVEGLLMYLEESSAFGVLARVDALSCAGSVALYDCLGQSMLVSPFVANTLLVMREFGAPWIFGTDDPASLLPTWQASVTEPAIVGNAWNRWPFPPAPRSVPGVPRGYLVEAKKA